ncbi:rod shape-determining protein MreC [Streptococcus mitis]|uniref:rod shape-determining protein MreC n=1 Tax=Streptococcus mitis TaxID=28037 RepID=UPI0021B4E149|nr:rod shape-determining protein MreC [Streptococcus mitis]
MNRFKKSKYVIIVFVIVLLVSALLATTYSSTIVTKLGDGISLVDRVVQKPFQWFDSVKSDLAHLTRTYNENESLKKQIYQLEVKSNEAESLKTENEQLRQLLDMKSKLQATKTLAADVIMRSPVSWKQELTLDAGKSKGASENMLAIANGGLIGSVSKVEENSTMVNLLTNTENADKISVKIQHGSTTIYGIIVGYDKENEVLKISQLNSSGDISAGDKVTTGGLGNFNVADIPVGEVVATTHSTDYLTREVAVKLSADTHNVNVIELVGNS